LDQVNDGLHYGNEKMKAETYFNELTPCTLRSLHSGAEFFRIRNGQPMKRRMQKLGYNRANKMMGYSASFTCGYDDDIGDSMELSPDTLVFDAGHVDDVHFNHYEDAREIVADLLGCTVDEID
jgi:hypothetical protein